VANRVECHPVLLPSHSKTGAEAVSHPFHHLSQSEEDLSTAAYSVIVVIAAI
jgi:hypothetical protein